MAPGPFRDLPREVAALSAVAFAVAVGFGVVAPAIPVFARDFGVGRTAAGAVISAFALMRLVSALLGGRLVDAFGERRVLATGIAIVAVSSALAGLAQSYLQLLVLRGIGGVGSAMFTVSALSLLLRTVGSSQRGRASGLFQAGFLVGGITGPALGGVLIGISIRAPFFVYAGTLTVAGAIGLVALRRTELAAPPDATSTPAHTSLRTALRHPAYRAAMAARFGDTWAVLGIRAALIPLFVTESLRASTVWVGVGFVVVAALNAVTLFPAGRVADSLGRKPVMVVGCVTSGAAMLLLALVPTLPGYLLAMAVFGAGSGLLDVAPAAVVGDVITGRGGTAIATYQMSGDAGTVLGPVIAGRLADTVSYGAAFGVTGAVLGAGALLSLLAPETRIREGEAEPAG